MSSSQFQCGGKPICSICYDDLKPIAEDLQSVPACGHVFHELCIQQWVEYAKKPNCPVCKQSFAPTSLLRLYFQSAAEYSQTLPQCPREVERLLENSRRLEGRLSALGSALEGQKRRVLELTDEVSRWKEKALEEEDAKDVALREKEQINRLLAEKKEELLSTSAECVRLRERSLALAKELATLKLATDVNLEEEEVFKLASLGGGSRLADRIDVLNKSLVMRNKSYKELMVQCSMLGRSESRALKKLEKAEEKIMKLKAQLQEFQNSLEKKENENLRNLKSSKQDTEQAVMRPASLFTNASVLGVECGLPADRPNAFASVGTSLTIDIKKTKQSHKMQHGMERKEVVGHACSPFDNDAIDSHFSFLKTSDDMLEHNHTVLYDDLIAQKSCGSQQGASPVYENVDYELVPSCRNLKCSTDMKKDSCARQIGSMNPNFYLSTSTVVCIDDDVCEMVLPNDYKNAADDINVSSGAPSLPDRLLRTKDDKRYPGRWCGRGRSTVSPTMETSTPAGGLISVGADGRGGKIKVLRPANQYPDKSQGQQPKKLKGEAKQVHPLRDHLRIEHFFGKGMLEKR